MTANDGVVIEGDTANYALGSPFYLLPNLESHSITSPSRREDTISCWPWPRGSRWRRAPGRPHRRVPADHFRCRLPKIAGYSMETYSKEEGDIDGPFSGSHRHRYLGRRQRKPCHLGRLHLLLDDQYNQQVSGANQDFFLNCVGWTCEGEEGAPSTPNRSPPSTLP